jgi:hypothetical protein
MEKYLKLAQQILDSNYHIVGFRVLCDDENYLVGDDCRQSYDWDVENDCSTYDVDGENGRKANGTCALHIDTQYLVTDDWTSELAQRIEEIIEIGNATYGKYHDNPRVIIAGNNGVNNDQAMDLGEVRIKNAFVIEIV